MGVNIETIVCEAKQYTDSLRLDAFEYLFSQSCDKPTLYSSVYACMINGWLGIQSNQEKREWAEYMNSYQQPNGFYVDPNCYNERFYSGDGWGARHLIPHMLIALQRLDSKPRFEFSFLEKINTPDKMISFLESLDYKQIWGTSNTIMNYGVTMQYARDYMGLPFHDSITAMEEWLLSHMRLDCAMWQIEKIRSRRVLYETIRGAYHIYPILLYDKVAIPGFIRSIPYILIAQNIQGGFDVARNSTACDDIDALDPLLRCAFIHHLQDNIFINIAIQRAKKNILRNRNTDGGFVFSRRGSFSYGGTEQLKSLQNESNLFGTWFRTLSLILLEEYLDNQHKRLMHFPGYELSLTI